MRYGEDQCEECGAVRVAKSMLCADCLVTRCHRLNEQRMDLKLTIESLKRDVHDCHRHLDAALSYGFEKNQENALLLRSHKRLEDQLEEAMKNGKDRETEDTGL